MKESALTNDFLLYVSKNEQNPEYRQMARELLEHRAKDIPYMIYEENELMCDDCDLTLPCCHKCLGA